MTATKTQRTRINPHTPLDTYTGLTATHTTWDGETLTGTVQRETYYSQTAGTRVPGRLIIRFPNGTWAYAGTHLNLVTT